VGENFLGGAVLQSASQLLSLQQFGVFFKGRNLSRTALLPGGSDRRTFQADCLPRDRSRRVEVAVAITKVLLTTTEGQAKLAPLNARLRRGISNFSSVATFESIHRTPTPSRHSLTSSGSHFGF